MNGWGQCAGYVMASLRGFVKVMPARRRELCAVLLSSHPLLTRWERHGHDDEWGTRVSMASCRGEGLQRVLDRMYSNLVSHGARLGLTARFIGIPQM